MKLAAQSAIFGSKAPADILRLASGAGFHGIELFPAQMEALAKSPAQLLDVLNSVGLELTALFVPFRLVWGEAAWIESRPRLTRLFETAKHAGCDLIEWGGGMSVEAVDGAVTDWASIVATYHRSADLAATHGLRSVFHPQVNHTVSTPEDVQALANHGLDFDAIALCPDSWQILRAGGDPLEVFRTFADRIGHYHLADCAPDGLRPAGLGTGVAPLPALIAQIRSTGYDAWLVLDSLPEDADPEAAGRSAVDYLADQWNRSASPPATSHPA